VPGAVFGEPAPFGLGLEPVSPPTRLTKRLILRRWVDTDRDPFAQMNADPEVMAYFPGLLSREESGLTRLSGEIRYGIRGGQGRFGQVTRPAWRRTRSR